jgi:hypothetical protein
MGVLHFAAKSLVEESQRRPDLYWDSNVCGTRGLAGSDAGRGSALIGQESVSEKPETDSFLFAGRIGATGGSGR